MDDEASRTPIPGVQRWAYEAFEHDGDTETRTVPLIREDGASAAFTVPEFVTDPEDLRQIATIVTGAMEKWEQVRGIGG